MRRRHTLTMALAILITLTAVPAQAQEWDFDDPAVVEKDVVIYEDDLADGDELWFAGGPWYGRGPGSAGRFGRGMQEELDLSKQQQSQLRELQLQFRKEMIPLRANLRVQMLELQEMIRKGAPQNDINRKIDEIGRLRADVQKKSVAHRLAMRNVLTEEQREIWDNRPHWGRGSMMCEPFEKMRKHFGRGGPKGRGL